MTIEKNGSNTLLSLNNQKGSFYYLAKGVVNLFMIELQEGDLLGKRTHIATIDAPALLFNFPPLEGYQVFAISESDVEFIVKSARDFKLLFETKESEGFLRKWVSQLALFLKERACVVKTQEELLQFQNKFLEKAKAEIKRRREEESALWQLRKQKQKEELSNSLKDLGSIISPDLTIVTPPGHSSLLLAMQEIGNTLDTCFVLPSDFPYSESPLIQVKSICHASKIRYRQVTLLGPFWKKEALPILAFYGEEKKAVALMKQGASYYVVDPETKKREPLDENGVQKLQKQGFCFYRSLPEEIKTGRQMLLYFFKNKWKELVPLLFYSLVGTLISLFPPLATGILFNKVVPNAEKSFLMQIGAGLFLAALSSSLFYFFRSVILVRLEGLASNEIQMALWDRLLKLPANFFSRYTSGNLIMRVIAIDQIRNIASSVMARTFLTGIFSIFYLFLMAFFSLKLTLVSLIVMVVGLLITFICSLVNVKLGKKMQEFNPNSTVTQMLAGIGKLRVMGAENSAFAYWASFFSKYKYYDLKSQHIQNIVLVTNSILPFFIPLLIFATVISSEGTLSMGTFLAFYAAYATFSMALFDLSNSLLQFVPIFPLWSRSKVILEEKQEVAIKKIKPGFLTGEISIDEVSFGYSKQDSLVLDNISISIHPEELVAVVGPSGCGKSTLVRLLLGFEEPKSGAIYYDEKDLQTLSLDEVRKQIGVVMQEGGIVSGSIHENLVCGGIYTPEQIQEALALSGFKQDLDSFPMGLYTILTIGGTTLSGGQKQRLLIARALLPKPKILIFDEATSALDNRTQEEISANIDRLKVTRLVIAHRLSTIKRADRIYVMDKGKIIETGTFSSLASQGGVFSKMLQRQSL